MQGWANMKFLPDTRFFFPNKKIRYPIPISDTSDMEYIEVTMEVRKQKLELKDVIN